MRTRAMWLVAALLLLLPGCFRNAKAPGPGERYVLEYAPPIAAGTTGSAIPDTLRIGRFSAAESLRTTQMVYRPAPFRKETDYYNRWIVPPESLVDGFLLRDFRQAGAFAAVASDDDRQAARFLLLGDLEAFEEVDGSAGRVAALAATITLLDLSKREIPERLLFQKTYRFEEPLGEEGPRGLAAAMSRAMSRFSARCIADATEAAQCRAEAPPIR